MEQDQQIVFGPLRFDRTTQCLWYGVREIRFRPSTRAVVRYLVEHPGRVMTRQELAQHVWSGRHVSQNVLRVCIWEIRQALDDQGDAPRYIEPEPGWSPAFPGKSVLFPAQAGQLNDPASAVQACTGLQ